MRITIIFRHLLRINTLTMRPPKEWYYSNCQRVHGLNFQSEVWWGRFELHSIWCTCDQWSAIAAWMAFDGILAKCGHWWGPQKGYPPPGGLEKSAENLITKLYIVIYAIYCRSRNFHSEKNFTCYRGGKNLMHKIFLCTRSTQPPNYLTKIEHMNNEHIKKAMQRLPNLH